MIVIARLDHCLYYLGWEKTPAGDVAEFDGPFPERNSYTFVALRKDRVVGALVVGVGTSEDVLWERGVLVAPHARRKGLALKLWARALKAFKPAVVHWSAGSPQGVKLIGRLKRIHGKRCSFVRED